MFKRSSAEAAVAAWPLEKTDQPQEQRGSQMGRANSNLGSAAGLNGVARPGLGVAWALIDRRAVAAPRTRRRDAPLLLHLGPPAGTARLGCACSVHDRESPGMAESLGPRVQAPPTAWRCREGRGGAELAGGGMQRVTRPSPHGLHERCTAATGPGSVAGGARSAGPRCAAGRGTGLGPWPVDKLPFQPPALAAPGGSQREGRAHSSSGRGRILGCVLWIPVLHLLSAIAHSLLL